MKNFFWKFAICLLPCALAAWVTINATYKYTQGDAGGFKLGVDLVGGTILVYEIDLRKNQDTDNKFDPVRDINILAESLKRRIDPNDLYNITIRPAGGEGRIEIILPTGGTHRTKKAEENWNGNHTLQMLEKEISAPRRSRIARGRPRRDRQARRSASRRSRPKVPPGKTACSSSPRTAGNAMQENALKYWAKLDNDTPDRERIQKTPVPADVDKAQRHPAGKCGSLRESASPIVGSESATTEKTIDNWLKIQAWEETMTHSPQVAHSGLEGKSGWLSWPAKIMHSASSILQSESQGCAAERHLARSGRGRRTVQG